MKEEFLTIQEAADFFGVSTRTLRRWEEKGFLTAQRTFGNQRRYSKTQLQSLFTVPQVPTVSVPKQTAVTPSVIAHSLQTSGTVDTEFRVAEKTVNETVVDRKGFDTPTTRVVHGFAMPVLKKREQPKFVMAFAGAVGTLFFFILTAIAFTYGDGVNQGRLGFNAWVNKEHDETSANQNVLAAQDVIPSYVLKVNAPTVFSKPVTFLDAFEIKNSLTVNRESNLFGGIKTNNKDIDAGTGRVIASNVLYSLLAGSNITLTGDPQNPTISASGGVDSVQGQTGTVVFSEGTGIGLDGLEISNTGVLSLQGQTGALSFSQGAGITLNGLSITNSDPGSAQKIYGTFRVGATDLTAGSNTDTITFAAGSGITLTPDSSSKKITITSDAAGVLSGLTTNGVLYATSATTATSTGAGTNGYILKSNGAGTAPEWVAPGTVLGFVPFDFISSGTNTTAAMVIGSGATLGYTGTGTINASSLQNATWVAPGAIGSTTPNTGAFTTLTATTINGLTVTANGSNTLTIATGKTITLNNSLALSGTDGTAFTFPSASGTLVSRDSTDTLTNKTIAAGSNTITGLTNTNLSGTAGITNANLANSSLTVTAGTGLSGGGSVSLGGTVALQNAGVTSAAGGSGISINAATGDITITNNGVTAAVAGSGIGVSGATGSVTFTNNGVTSLTGTANQVNVSGSTGSVTLTLPQNIHTAATPTFGGLTLSSFVNNGGLLYTNGSGTFAQSSTVFAGINGLGIGSNAIGNGKLIINQENASGDILSASSAGTTRLTLSNGGNLNLAGTYYANGVAGITQGSASCVTTTNGIVTGFGTCQLGSEQWEIANGAIYTGNPSLDLLLGGTSTASAKFAVINISGGTPTATVSAATGNDAAYLAGNGVLGTTNAQTLTVGSSSTGNVVIDAGSGSIILSDATTVNGGVNLALGNGYSINSVSVLNATTLGANVVNSSLTQVGALANGSIANGFGSIFTANTIQGSNLTASGTTGFTSSGNGAGLTFSGTGNHDISASAGTLRLGDVTLNGAVTTTLTGNNSILYTGAGTGILTAATTSTASQCLLSGASSPTWGNCALGSNYWQTNNGTVSPFSNTLDLLVGGTASNAAKFAVLNVNTGTPTASVSAGTAGAAYLTAAGALQTTANQSLSLGGNTTGNILLNSDGGSLIGVGTTAPSAMFHVSSSTATDAMRISTTSSTPWHLMFDRTDVGGSNINFALNNAGSFLACNASSQCTMLLDQSGKMAIGGGPSTTTATLHVNTRSGTDPAASVSGQTARASVVIDQSGVGDLFTASKSGKTHFTIANNGSLNVMNRNVMNFYNDTGATLRGFVGQEPSSTDLALISKTASSWLRLGAASGGAIGFWTDGNADANTTPQMLLNSAGRLSIGAGSGTILGTLDARATGAGSYDLPVASFSGQTGKATVIADQSGSGDIFTASKSGATKFTITNSGTVAIGAFPRSLTGSTPTGTLHLWGNDDSTNAVMHFGDVGDLSNAYIKESGTGDSDQLELGGRNGVILATAGSGSSYGTARVTISDTGSVRIHGLTSCNTIDTDSNGVLSCGTDDTGVTTNYWQLNNGAVSPFSNTADLLVGGTASGSAKFAILNVNSGTPTASVSAGTTGAAYLTAAGSLQTTANQTLSLGGNSTGNILLNSDGDNFVGIGISNPTARLAVAGNGTGTALIGDPGTGSNYTAMSLNGLLNGTDYNFASSPTDGTLYINRPTGSAVRFREGNGTDQLYLAIGGNLGIGTNAPTALLDVAGAASVSGSLSFRTGAGSIQTTANNTLTLGGNTTGNILLNSDGNNFVGIGTTTPTARLDVSGTIRATGSTIPTTGAGLEMQYDGSTTYLTSFNRGGGGYLPLNIDASILRLNASSGGNVIVGGPGSLTPLAKLDVRGGSFSEPSASISGFSNNVSVVVDNNGIGDLLTASKSGATKFTILNNGNVRINNLTSCGSITTDTTGLLGCSGAASSLFTDGGAVTYLTSLTDDLALGGTSSTAPFFFDESAEQLILTNTTVGESFRVNDVASDTTPFVIDTDGDVGIGTTSPEASLDIFRPAGSDAVIGMRDGDVAHGITNYTATDRFFFIQPLSSTGGGAHIAGLSDGDISGVYVDAIIGAADPTDTTAAIRLNAHKRSGVDLAPIGTSETVLQLTNNFSSLLTILGSGNVGIGTETPRSDLDLGQDGAILTLGGLSSGATVRFGAATDVNSIGYNNNGFNFLTDQTNGFEFFTNTDSDTATAEFRITDAGNVGIGSAAPSTLLQVTGSKNAHAGAGTAANYLQILRNNNATDGQGAGIGFISNTSDTDIGGNIILTRNGSGGRGDLSFGVKQSGSGGAAPVEMLSLNSDNTVDLGGTTLNATSLATINLGGTAVINGGTAANNDLTLQGTSNATRASSYVFIQPNGGSVGIGNVTTPLATLDIRGNVGTMPVASVSGTTAMASLVVDNNGIGDLFVASKSGATKFTVLNNGNVRINNLASCGSITTDATGLLSCSGAASSLFTDGGAVTYLTSLTDDLALGGTNSSAPFFFDESAEILTLTNTTAGDSFIVNDVAGDASPFVIDASGNVGIGDPTPGAKLDVNGVSRFNFYLDSGAYGINVGGGLNAAQWNTSIPYFLFNSSDNLGYIFKNNSGARDLFKLEANGTAGLGVPVDAPMLATLDIRAQSGTLSIASLSGNTARAALFVENNGLGDLFVASNAGDAKFVVSREGYVGIGVTDPGHALAITSGGVIQMSGGVIQDYADFNIKIDADNNSTTDSFNIFDGVGNQLFSIEEASGTVLIGNGTINYANFPSQSLILDNGAFCVDDGGDNCDDAARTAGTIYAESTAITAIDLAENYPSKDTTLEAGEIVVADQNNTEYIKRSNRKYQNSVIGVVSTKPGILLGAFGEEAKRFGDDPKYPIAMAGRIPVKVSTENGPIKPGDYLTSSSVPGVAMKATQPGATVAKALEAYDNADPTVVGKAVSLVNVSWFDPRVSLTEDGNVAVDGVSMASGQVSEVQGPIAAQNASNGLPSATEPFDADVFNKRVASTSALKEVKDSGNSFGEMLKKLSDRVASLETIASGSALFSSAPLDFTASSSADLGLATLDVTDATVSESLAVLGRTTLSDVGITGKVNIGLLSIEGLDEEGTAAINTSAGPLRLQATGLNGIDILNGKITIDKSGDIKTKGSVTTKKVNIDTSDVASASLGEVVLESGLTKVTVTTNALTDKSKIFVQAQEVPITTAVKKIAEDKFEIRVRSAETTDVKLHWWIVN